MKGIKFENIVKSYDGKNNVIDNFNLNIKDGEFIVLLGPSGCGKSTLLRILAGLEDIQSGNIYIDYLKINDMEPKDRDIAMVFQNYALYPHMTVYKNIAIGLILKKVPKDEIDKKVKEVSSMLHINELLDRKPRQLSGGQMQRVALARAMIRDPKVFLMDEPLSNLDSKLRVETRTEIMKLYRKLKTTTIYVTHDQVEAMTMATEIVLLKDGVIMQHGKPQELYSKPLNLFTASFIGSPEMNFFEFKPLDNKIDFYNNEINIDTSDDIIMGIRPEDVKIIPGNDFKIELIEDLGSEKLVYLISNNKKDEIIARCSASDTFNLEKSYSVKLNSNIHIFNKKNGNRIN